MVHTIFRATQHDDSNVTCGGSPTNVVVLAVPLGIRDKACGNPRGGELEVQQDFHDNHQAHKSNIPHRNHVIVNICPGNALTHKVGADANSVRINPRARWTTAFREQDAYVLYGS